MVNRKMGSFFYVAVLLYLISSQKELVPLCSSFKILSHSTLRYVFQLQTFSLPLSASSIELDDSTRDKDEHYMRLALRHAQHSFREKEVPIGAVIVDSNGIILASSRNEVESKQDVTAHAEISCIRKAAQIKNNWRLSDCTLYSTLEPCPMCMGAIQASRIKKVVYGASDIRMGACGSWINLVDSKHPFHNVEVVGGLLQEESSTLLKRFFQMRRREAATIVALEKDKLSNSANINVSNDSGSEILSGKNGVVEGVDSTDEARFSHIDRGYLAGFSSIETEE